MNAAQTSIVEIWTASDVYALLSDATNGTANLLKILDTKMNGKKLTGYYFVADASANTSDIKFTGTDGKEAKVTVNLSSAITKGADLSYYEDLCKKSSEAFGDAKYYVNSDAAIMTMQNGYLHKLPSEDDVKYVVGFAEAGAYGAYLASLDEDEQFKANNYEAIIADLQAAVTKWTALVAEIVAEIETEAAEVKAANVAYAAADDKFNAYVKAITDKYEIAKAELGGKERALTAIKGKLAEYVNDELENNDYTELEEWLAGKIETAEYDVIAAQEKVVRAENAIQRAKDGKYTTAEALAQAEEDLDAAMATLEKAQAELDEALADLNTALEIMSAE